MASSVESASSICLSHPYNAGVGCWLPLSTVLYLLISDISVACVSAKDYKFWLLILFATDGSWSHMHVMKSLSSWNGTLTLVQAAFRHPRRCSFITSRLDPRASLVSRSVAYMSRGCLISPYGFGFELMPQKSPKLRPMSRPCPPIFTGLPVLCIIPAHAPVANADYLGWNSDL